MTIPTGGKDKKKGKKGKKGGKGKEKGGAAAGSAKAKDHLKDPLQDPLKKDLPKLGAHTAGRVDAFGGKASLNHVNTQVDGSSTTLGLNAGATSGTLSYGSENGWAEGQTHGLKLDGKRQSMNLFQTQKTGDASQTQNLSLSKGGVGYSNTSLDAQKNSASQAFGLGPTGLSYSDTQKDGRGVVQNQNSLSVGPGQVAGAVNRNGRGVGMRTGEQGTYFSAQRGGFGLELGMSEDQYVVGGSAKIAKNSANLRLGFGAKGYSADAGVNIAGKGVGMGYSDIDGEVTTRESASLGFLAVGESSSELNRSTEGYQGGEQTGPSYSSSHNTGSSWGKQGAFFVTGAGGRGQKQGYSVDSESQENGRITVDQGRKHMAAQKALEAGLPVAPESLAMNQSVSRSQEQDQNWKAGLDVVLADGSVGGSSREGSRQTVARREDGIHLQDTHVQEQGSTSSGGIGWGLVHTSEDTEASQAVQVLDYLVDPGDPQGMGYAQDYAQVGLLPEWDLLGDKDQVSELKAALATARNQEQDPKAWETFRSKQQERVDGVNDAIRAHHAQGSLSDETLGIRLMHATGSESKDEGHKTSTLLFMGGSENKTEGAGVHHGVDAAGSPYTERSFSQGRTQDGKDKGSRQVTVSGDFNAATGLRVQNENMKRYRNHRLDLSPAVLQALGEALNASGSAQALWCSLTHRAKRYWTLRAHETGGAGWPGDYRTMFDDIDGPDAFLDLPGQHQVAYIKGACAEGVSTGRSSREPKAIDKSGTQRGFDALAAISTLEEGRFRDEAMMEMAKEVTGAGRDPFAELRRTGKLLPGGGEYLAEQAANGVQGDSDLLTSSQDEKVWALELQAVFESASSQPAMRLLEAVHLLGDPEMMGKVIHQAGLTPYKVALKLASDSQDNPRRFVEWIGPAGGDQLSAWWTETKDKLGRQAIARDLKIDAAKPERQVKLDGGRGLGNSGMDMEQVGIQMAMWEEGQKMPEVPVIRAAGSSGARKPSIFGELPLRPVPAWEEMTLGKALEASLKSADYPQAIQILSKVRGQYGAPGVEQLVFGVAGRSAPWPAPDTPEGARFTELLEGTQVAR